MSKKAYQEQLANLRDLGFEFSKVHPAIAPMLSESSTDPDVERLLEGVAFLNGLIQEKLDDEFPEIVHGLMDVIFPQYLRPVPALSIAVLDPKPNMMESITIPAGVSINSKPVDDTICPFRTCFSTEVHPLKLTKAWAEDLALKGSRIHLECRLTGPTLDQWQPETLRFYAGEDFSQGAQLFILFRKYLKRIILKPKGEGSEVSLEPRFLRYVGFDLKNSLLPYPPQSFGGLRLLQEYFVLPEKYLFYDLTGFDQWIDRGEGIDFEIIFEFMQHRLTIPRISERQFFFFATPIVNLYKYESDPISLDHKREKLQMRPSYIGREHFQVFSVEKVLGFEIGSVAKHEYVPLEKFARARGKQSSYSLVRARSAIDDLPETFLMISYPEDNPNPVEQTLTLTLTCTNGNLPERLRRGDICMQTVDLSELVSPTNIMSPTSAINPLLGQQTLWKFLSHLSLNFLELADADNLKALLELYIHAEGRDRIRITANQKRINGIQSVEVKPMDRMVQGSILRGRKVEMTSSLDHFANMGDLYLFASVIDLFLGTYSNLNTFVAFELLENLSGDRYTWQPRLGDRLLT